MHSFLVPALSIHKARWSKGTGLSLPYVAFQEQDVADRSSYGSTFIYQGHREVGNVHVNVSNKCEFGRI